MHPGLLGLRHRSAASQKGELFSWFRQPSHLSKSPPLDPLKLCGAERVRSQAEPHCPKELRQTTGLCVTLRAEVATEGSSEMMGLY